MKKFLKRFLIYLIMTMLVLPTWLVTGMSKAEHAKAADGLSIETFTISNPIFSPNNDGIKDDTTIDVSFSGPANGSIDVYDVNGNLVKELYKSDGEVTNPTAKTWNGKTSEGGVLADGIYSVKVVAATESETAQATKSVEIDNSLAVGTTDFNAPRIITKSDDGTNFKVVITYSEAMDKTVEPVVKFNYNDSEFRKVLTCTGSWEDSTTYVYNCAINGLVALNVPSSAITISGAKDLAGNLQVPVVTKGRLSVGLVVLPKVTFLINDGAKYTKDSLVNLKFTADSETPSAYKEMNLSNNPDFLADADNPNSGIWVPFSNSVSWKLDSTVDGEKTVYAQFRDADGNITVPEVVDSIALDTAAYAPTQVVAKVEGGKVLLEWLPVSDLSGVSHYLIYSSADEYKEPFNTTKVEKNSFTVEGLTDGSYTFAVVAVDNAGNQSLMSEASNEVVVDTTVPVAPEVKISSLNNASGKFIHLEWIGVGGFVDKYEVYVNGVASPENTVLVDNTKSDLGVSYTKDIKVLADGKYDTFVKVWKGSVSNVTSTKSIEFITVETKTEPVIPAVTETPAPAPVSVAAPKASAKSNDSAVTETPSTSTDDSGKIKGDETPVNDASKVNWTPWIVLFVLIIMAGAATGGYFYWFNGEEEVSAVVRAAKKTSVEKVSKPAPKSSKPSKKTKRW